MDEDELKNEIDTYVRSPATLCFSCYASPPKYRDQRVYNDICALCTLLLRSSWALVNAPLDLQQFIFFSLPVRAVRSLTAAICDCLSSNVYSGTVALISQKPHIRISPNCLCVLPVAVARSSSGDIAIRYVLPV